MNAQDAANVINRLQPGVAGIRVGARVVKQRDDSVNLLIDVSAVGFNRDGVPIRNDRTDIVTEYELEQLAGNVTEFLLHRAEMAVARVVGVALDLVPR